MSLLQELYQISTEQVDSLPSAGTYIPLPDESKPKRKKTKRTAFPSTDNAQNSLINFIWFAQNADAV